MKIHLMLFDLVSNSIPDISLETKPKTCVFLEHNQLLLIIHGSVYLKNPALPNEYSLILMFCHRNQSNVKLPAVQNKRG